MILLLVLTEFLFAANQIDFETGMRAETNAYYRDNEAESDVAIYLKPNILLQNEGKKAQASLSLNSEYGKHLSFAELDYLDYTLGLGLNYLVSSKTKLKSKIVHGLLTEPSQVTKGENFERQTTTASLGFDYKKTSLTTHYFDAYTDLYDYSKAAYNYMVGQRIGFDYQMEYFFLPETAFLVLVSADQVNYPEGRINRDNVPGRTDFLNNSIGYKVAAGFEGRLTEHSLFYFTFGYYVRDYTFDSSFNEPIFEVNFQEQITPQDTLMAGYIYQVDDSLYTNYEINQQMYLAYSRVFGDRFIFLFKSNYLYKSFSRPTRREDQKLYGTVQIDYSYKPNWLYKIGFSGDILISDALNQDTNNVNFSDPGASYQAFQLYVATKIVF